MKRALLPITLVTLLSIFIYSCSSGDDDSAPPSVIQTPTAEPEETITQYTLTVSAGEYGSVSTEGGKYDEGTEITVRATPAEGYKFTEWSDGNNLIERQITVNEDIVVEAKFGLKYSSYNLNINHSQKGEIIQNLSITSNSTVMFKKSGLQHIISNPANPRGEFESLLPTIHFVKNEGWEVSSYYDIGMSFGGRDESKINDDYDYLFADHGTEVWFGGGEGRPYNNVWVAKNIDLNNIEWIKVNQKRSFYHDASSGDLNGDGLYDVVGIHGSTNSADYLDQIYYHTFLQNPDGTFTQDYNTIKFYGSQSPSYDCWDFPEISDCTGIIRGSVLIKDINGDNKPEIIGGAYTHNPQWGTPEEVNNSFEIFSDPDEDGIFEKLNFLPRMGWWEYGAIGSDEIKGYDYDGDGDTDLIVGLEGSLQEEYSHSATFNGVQIYNNDGKNNFSFSNIEMPFDDLRIARFDLFDVDQDNDLDIVFSANLFIDLGTIPDVGSGSSFYYKGENRLFKALQNNKEDNEWNDTLIDFDELIFYNEGGSYSKKNMGNKVMIEKGKANINSNFVGRGIETVNSSVIDGKLIFYLYKTGLDENRNLTLDLIEFEAKTLK